MQISFFKESVQELKKVQTPGKEEIIRATVGVFFMLFLFGAFLGLTDYAAGELIRFILNLD